MACHLSHSLTTAAVPCVSKRVAVDAVACRGTLSANRCCVASMSRRVGLWASSNGGTAIAERPAGLTQTGKPGGRMIFHGVHHVGLLCANLERSLEFYCGILGLEINTDRPDAKLPYRGAWLWIGPEMIHLMELPNPDPLTGRPEHGGRDRHFCVGLEDITPLETRLKEANVPYTMSMSGRRAMFFRDPDMNCLECVETVPWRGA